MKDSVLVARGVGHGIASTELAETAMNDILGWYGYDSVDRLELAANNLASASTSGTIDEDGAEGRLKPDSDHIATRVAATNHLLLKAKSIAQASAASSKHHPLPQQPSLGGHFFPRQQDDPSGSSSNERRGRETPSIATGRPGLAGSPPATTAATARNGVGLHHQSHHHAPVPAGGGESSTSEKDSSRESSKSPMLMKMLDKQEQTCQWCRKVIPSHQTGILGTTEGMIFCTEACFSQSRRASFKRAKTCDWCRHVRHAVSYVDFQDGASQLQFCSDKCLNHLITPELWMKNCKSCSMSPVSDRSESVSPVPSLPVRSSPEPSPITLHSPTPSKKPLISVAPPSKLLSKTLQHGPLGRPSPKSASRKRRPANRPQSSALATTSSKRSSTAHQLEYGSISSSSGNSSINNNNNATIPNNNLTGSTANPSTLGQPKSTANVQDLRILQKKHSAIVNLASNAVPASITGFDHARVDSSGPVGLGPPPPPPPPPPPLNIPPQFLPPPLNLLRPPFFPLNPAQLRFGNGMGNVQGTAPSMGPPPSPLPGGPLGPGSRPPLPNLLGFGTAPPPVTILVPYPIIVPLPLPIPVPIPVIDFLKAALPKDEHEKQPEQSDRIPEEGLEFEATVMTLDSDETMADELAATPVVEDELDVPLDFTVGGCTNHSERDVARSAGRVEVWSEPEQCADSAPAYALSTIGFAEPETVPSMEDTKSTDCRQVGSAKLVLPRFKITRLASTPDPGERIDGERRPVDEEDIERERKEMVERSRPLRKRKRLVVPQQQHQLSEPELNDLQEPPGEAIAEAQEFSSGIGLRSGGKTK
uniref:Sine oculis-binding protein n=1 Tax=Anopheles dirus TaxID=7168 RepID=A0A182NSZ2_9DIPT